MTFNEKIFNELTAHSILVLSYIKGLQKKYSKIILQYNEPTRNLISSHLAKVKTRNVRTQEWSDFVKKLTVLRKQMILDIKGDFSPEATEFRRKELWFLLGLFDEISPVMHKWIAPELDSMTAEVILGQTISQRFQTMVDSDINAMVSKIKRLFSVGMSSAVIINSVIGIRSNNYAGSSVGKTINNVNANISTIISGLASSTQNGFTKANNKVIGYEVFVAVLDSKTTELCASHDGDIYRIGEGLFPPLHENCRSRRYPFINGLALVEGRIFYQKDGDGYIRKSFYDEARYQTPNWSSLSATSQQRIIDKLRSEWVAKNIGLAPKTYNYETFLRSQSDTFQERMLGKTKAKLFRDGNLSIDQFIDASGRQLTLKELSSLYRESFVMANIKIGA